MAFRTHLGRSLDVGHRPNLVLVVLTGTTAVISLILWLNGAEIGIMLAAAHVFVAWTLIREIEPDQEWVALVGAGLAAIWVLRGGDTMSALVLGVVMVSARIVSETTGRRPLPTDLAVVALAGIGIGFTPIGWIAGFGMAIALYLDDRLSGEGRAIQVWAAVATAAGTTIVGAVTGALPRTLSGLVPYLAISSGLIALLLVLREPPEPTSVVDARHGAPLRKERLHWSRSLVAIEIFAMVLVSGATATAMIPAIAALSLALIASELGRATQQGR